MTTTFWIAPSGGPPEGSTLEDDEKHQMIKMIVRLPFSKAEMRSAKPHEKLE